MKSVTIVSAKGGVGKTTLAVNLAVSCAREGIRTLLIDTDIQGGVANALRRDIHTDLGLAGFVAGQIGWPEVRVTTKIPKLSIVPLGDVGAEQNPLFEARLADGQLLETLLDSASDEFDLALIDTPASFGGSTLGSLRASGYALCPIQAQPMALRAFPRFLEILSSLKAGGTPLEVVGIVLSMVQLRNEDSLKTVQEVWSDLPLELVFDASIPYDEKVLRSQTLGLPVAYLSRPTPPIAKVFDQLADELISRVGLFQEPESTTERSIFHE